MEKLKKLILNHNFDLVGLAEVNRDWRKLKYEHTIWGATAGWCQHRRIQVSQNTTKPCSDRDLLTGGTALMAFGEFVFRIPGQESDPRKLGRWSNFSITGKNNTITSIFMCYCPVRGTSSGSAFAQQLIYMAENKESIPETPCPRQMFGIDLKAKITEKINLGHKVIVMGDFNAEYKKLMRWMSDLGLIDLVAAKHGDCPKTHIRSKNEPIDCIFGSASLSIAQGGFLSFNKLLSDHRGIWVDIPVHQLYGYNPPQPVYPYARRLKLNDPRVIKKYIEILDESMRHHDLYRRMDNIHQQAAIHLSEQLLLEYEEIYALSMKLMQKAEKKCRKIHTGIIPWSPDYQKARLTLEYWLHRKSYLLSTHSNVRYIIRLQNKLRLPYDPSLTLGDINNQIKAAQKQRRQCMLYAESLSLEYRTQLALAKEEAGEVEAATYIRNLNHIEAQRRLFRNIRHMEGKSKGGCTSKVIKQVGLDQIEFTKKEDIERLCAETNELKYHQIEGGGSQLLLPQFINDLGSHGESKGAKQVIDGTYVPPVSATQATVDFLASCKGTPLTQQLVNSDNDVVTRYKKFSSGWKIRKESTCTHHLHIGHYKASLKNKDLSWFLFQRSDLPETTGYSPTYHRECINLMIMKKSFCYDVTKQRTIGILDTEFNQSNKIIGKDAMTNGFKMGAIATEQFAVKKSAAIHQIISKRCMIDHHHSKRSCFSLTSSDLLGCYDRIIHTAAALALLRVGIPHSKINSMFASIKRMTHKIRTMYGDSDISYGGDDIGKWQNYPQGVIQGNAGGPTIWVLLSSIIFDILHQRGFAVQVCSSISRELFCLVGFAYVDDCDLIQSGTDPIVVLASMQSLINSWGSLMEVTGGALSVSKSWWYLIEYVWKKGKWVAHDASSDLDLVATSASGDLVSLKRLYANEASAMLGVWIAPNGDKNKLFSTQRQAALSWGTKVIEGNPSQLEAWQALHSNISAKLKYPLPACSFTETECKSILYPAIRSALPKAGIASNLVGLVRDGPLDYGGAGVISLYHYQGTARTAVLVEQIFKKTFTGKWFLTCLEDLVLEAGLFGSIWNMPFDLVSQYVSTHSLVFDIWKYNSSNNIVISTPHGELGPKRHGDQSLMSLAFAHFPDTVSLRSIQRVRMALGVVSISDICSADGRTLDDKYLHSTLLKPCKNRFNWPMKHKINRHDMAKWRKFVRRIFHVDNRHLLQALGYWLNVDNEQWISTWDFFITSDKQFLFRRISQDTWHRYLLKPHSRRSYFTTPLVINEPPTETLLRATTRLTNHTIIVISSSPRICDALQPPQDILSFGNIQITQPIITWFMNSIQSSVSTDRLLYHILQGTALAVSDGSFLPLYKVGSCSWIISTPDGKEYIKGGGLIPGSSDHQSAYRSELGGQLGLASIISNIILPPSLNTKMTVACDGLAALQKVNISLPNISSRSTDCDLISIINHLWKESPITPSLQHVYGHQDTSKITLSPLERLNCDMDADAKEIAHNSVNRDVPKTTFPPTSLGLGTITCGGKLITSSIQTSLYNHITTSAMYAWLSKNTEADAHLNYQSLALNCFATARKETSLGMKLFITKWLSGDTATGKVMKLRKQWMFDTCPRCDSENEHLLHVITCPASQASNLRQRLISDLMDWLRDMNTHPCIIKFIHLGVKKWISNRQFKWQPHSAIFSDCPSINKALTSQLQVGWYYFLCGILTTELVELQQSYYTQLDSKRSSTRWAANLIKKLWKFLHQLWTQRNEALHHNQSLYHMTNLHLLKQSITTEYNIGLDSLPPIYSSYFHLPLPNLLQKSSSYLKRWFLVIRSGRESDLSFSSPDIFSINGPLRSWIRLQAVT